MNRSRFLQYGVCLVALLLSATFALAGKPAPPPPTPIVATTTDRNFLEVDVNKVSCQTEFDLAVSVSGTGTHYRYKVGPFDTTNPGVLSGYSAPIPKATPVTFSLAGSPFRMHFSPPCGRLRRIAKRFGGNVHSCYSRRL